MPNLLRYVFGFMGILSLGALVVLDKIYTGGQPVPERVYLIVWVFILGCLIGADNLTSLASALIKRFIWDGKKD